MTDDLRRENADELKQREIRDRILAHLDGDERVLSPSALILAGVTSGMREAGRENAELRATIDRLRSDVSVLATQRETLWHALEQILHVQLHESMEWETVQRIVDAGVEGFDEAYGYPEIPNSYRVVTTVEELDALPDRTILESGGVAYQQSGIYTWATGGEDSWYCTVPLPARVLWLPTEGDGS